MNLARAIVERVRRRFALRRGWLASRPDDAPWTPLDGAASQRTWEEEDAHAGATLHELRALEDEIGRAPRWRRLVDAFDLDTFEQDVVQTCLAAELDPDLAGAWSLVTRTGPPWPHVAAIRALFGHPLDAVILVGSALRTWELVVDHPAGAADPPRLGLDPVLRDRLLGRPSASAWCSVPE